MSKKKKTKVMNSEELRDFAVNSLDEHKGEDIKVIDVQHSTITDYMIICSGSSGRHVNALAEHIIEESKHAGHQPLGKEADERGEWTLVDLGDVIVHIMLPATREIYSLEKLWGIEMVENNRDED